MYPALLYKRLPGERINCQVCQHRCLIDPGKTGFCLVRKNINGELFSLNYGVLTGLQLDPVEKKPLYHFHPGENTLSLGSYGCNFRCRQCLNWSCSWGEPATSILKTLAEEEKNETILPKQVIETAKKESLSMIAFTYNEPTVWLEYVLDCAKLAKKEKMKTIFVTNGFWTKKTLKVLAPVIDAANVDVKGATEKSYRRQGAFLGKILDNLIFAQKKGIHLELTTLVIPGINDQEKELKTIARWVVKNLGEKTPWHLSRFSPELAPDKAFRKIKATSEETLERAYHLGKEAGLKFVYVWAPASQDQPFFSIGDTICPGCGRKVIGRRHWQPEIKEVTKQGKCKNCKENLNLIN